MTGMADFFREKRSALVAYVRRRIDDAADQDAEDIVQDVVTGLFDRADPTIPIQNLLAFVYRALRNRIIDRFRRRRETLPLLEDVLGSDGGGVGDPVLEFERQETLEEVFAALEGLAPEEREVILATELEGRTFKELAAEWRVPLGTLLARKSRGLEKIRKRLTGQIDMNQGEEK